MKYYICLEISQRKRISQTFPLDAHIFLDQLFFMQILDVSLSLSQSCTSVLTYFIQWTNMKEEQQYKHKI
jgi:hypothetical protein